MTKEEEQKAADELRVAALKKDYYEKKLLEAGFVIDYSQDGTILNIRKPIVIEL
jgi:hypothetical protein